MAFFLAAVPAVWSQSVSIVAGAPAAPVMPGQVVTMSVSAGGAAATYQWRLNGADIPGATGASYMLTAAGAADRGAYEVVVMTPSGSTTTKLGTMAVAMSDARLINLSARGTVGTGNDVMIAGFVSQGDSHSTNKNILMRGMGPSLAGMMGEMMSGLLAQPVLTLYDGHARAMGSDMGWMNAPSRATGSGASPVPVTMQPASMSMMQQLGAFAPMAGSADAALMMNAPPGAYSAIVSGSNDSTGIALVECYDADAAAGNGSNSARLVNMSARANAGAGNNSLIAGFVITGGPQGTPETVLLRAMGPALVSLGVNNFMPATSMTLYDHASKPIATDTGWSSAPTMAVGDGVSPVRAGIGPALAATMAQVGAFPAAAGSADSALVAALPPGAYSVVVSGAPGASGQMMSGVVLVEAYEVR